MFQCYSQGIMVRLGNFPGFNLLHDNNSELPLDFEIEQEIKKEINKAPYSEKIFTDEKVRLYDKLLDKNYLTFSWRFGII